MTSTTPRTQRNANYIVYTACAVGMAGLASVGLATGMRDTPLKSTPAGKPAITVESRPHPSSTSERSRRAGSKPENPEQKPPKAVVPSPVASAPGSPKGAPSEAQAKPAAIPADTTLKAMLHTVPATATATATTEIKPPPTPARAPAPTYAPATAAQRAEIIAAVERGDRAERKALRTLDLSVIKATHSGAAYNVIRDVVKNLKKEGYYIATEYAGSKVDGVKIASDGQKAQVRTTETWESSWYSSDANVCKAHVHKRPIPQTVFLTLGKQGWVISDVKHDNPGQPTFVKCHN